MPQIGSSLRRFPPIRVAAIAIQVESRGARREFQLTTQVFGSALSYSRHLEGRAYRKQLSELNGLGKERAAGNMPRGIGRIGGHINHRQKRGLSASCLRHVPAVHRSTEPNIGDQGAERRSLLQNGQSAFTAVGLQHRPAGLLKGGRQLQSEQPFVLDDQDEWDGNVNIHHKLNSLGPENQAMITTLAQVYCSARRATGRNTASSVHPTIHGRASA